MITMLKIYWVKWENMIKCSNNYLSFNSTATDKFFGNIGHYLCLS